MIAQMAHGGRKRVWRLGDDSTGGWTFGGATWVGRCLAIDLVHDQPGQERNQFPSSPPADTSSQGLQDLVAALGAEHHVKPLSKQYQRVLDRSIKSVRDCQGEGNRDIR